MIDYPANSGQVGWKFLLGAAKLDQVLCFDTTSGEIALAFAPSCNRLWVAHADSSSLNMLHDRLDAEGIINANFINIIAGLDRLPFDNMQFDAVILPSLEAVLSWASMVQVNKMLRKLISEVRRILRTEGYFFFISRNRCFYQLFPILWNKLPGSISVSSCTLQRFLDHYGFRQRRIYPLLLSGQLISEVLVEKQYRSVRTSFALKERLKELLFHPRFSQNSAPALAFMASPSVLPRTMLDNLLEDIQHNEYLPKSCEQNLSVKRYFILPGKVILSVGYGLSRFGCCIIVLPMGFSTLARRRHEVKILGELHRLELPISKLVPKFLFEGLLAGQPYLIQSEIPGISIDREIVALDDLTKRAARLLTEFHNKTSTHCSLNEKLFIQLFTEPLATLAGDLGSSHNGLIQKIGDQIYQCLSNTSLKTVWVHGDFKIENLLVDQRNLEIVGVIDWDLSQQNGLPLLDLIYLLLFNRRLRTDKSIGTLVLEVLLPLRLTDFEQDILMEYIEDLQLSTKFVQVLFCAFWIHHLALRERPRTEVARSNAVKVLKAVAAHLEYLSPTTNLFMADNISSASPVINQNPT